MNYFFARTVFRPLEESMVHFLTARRCAFQAAPWSQLSGGSKPNARATTPTMPAPNHPQPAANAKIIAALFPLSCQLAEAAPRELSHQQRAPRAGNHDALWGRARSLPGGSGGAAGGAQPHRPCALSALHRSVELGQWAARRPLARTLRDQAAAAANCARRGELLRRQKGLERYRRRAQY